MVKLLVVKQDRGQGERVYSVFMKVYLFIMCSYAYEGSIKVLCWYPLNKVVATKASGTGGHVLCPMLPNP